MFTGEEIQHIIQLASSGLNQGEIAEALGIPLATLRFRILNSGYRFHTRTEVVRVQAVAADIAPASTTAKQETIA